MTSVRLPDGTNIDGRLTVGGPPPTAGSTGSATISNGSTYTAGTFSIPTVTSGQLLFSPGVPGAPPAWNNLPHVIVQNRITRSGQAVTPSLLSGGTLSIVVTGATASDVFSYLIIDQAGD